jgi:hypothetical protein
MGSTGLRRSPDDHDRDLRMREQVRSPCPLPGTPRIFFLSTTVFDAIFRIAARRSLRRGGNEECKKKYPYSSSSVRSWF